MNYCQSMKILLLNTTDIKGGAAIASYRLLNALRNKNVDVNLLVSKKITENENVQQTSNSFTQRLKKFYWFAYERFVVSKQIASKEYRFSFSPANTGEDITENKLVQAADIIHLHWINFGFLSLTTLEKLFSMDKIFVWTMHDMWAFSGGCHYSGTCSNFTNKCLDCWFLKNPAKDDLSNKVFTQKQQLYKDKKIHFVGCSKWLAQTAQQSKLLQNFSIESLPNPLNTKKFQPINKSEARTKLGLPPEKKLILFGADIISDKRKGLEYLLKALEEIHSNKQHTNTIELLTFGSIKKNNLPETSFKMNVLSYLKDVETLRTAYSAADMFVLPTLEDNLPNTVMESMACGTPVVAYNTGGIPEMIDHKTNGYIASYRSTDDLANGILYILFEADTNSFRESARNKVLKNYEQNTVADKYLALYEKLIS